MVPVPEEGLQLDDKGGEVGQVLPRSTEHVQHHHVRTSCTTWDFVSNIVFLKFLKTYTFLSIRYIFQEFNSGLSFSAVLFG